MAEENTGIPVAVEISGDEGSQEESFDIPPIAVAEVSEPEDIIEESIDIPAIAVAEVSEPEDIIEESIDIPAITEVNELECDNVEVIVDISTPKVRPKIFSRYLLPSGGSCHDLCKYGIKHPLEGKPASSVLRKVKSVGGDGQDLRRIMISLAKQNRETISTKSSPDHNAQFSINNTDLKGDIISSPGIIVVSPKRLLPSIKEVQAAAVHYSRTKPNFSQSKASSFAGQGSSGTKRNKEVRKGKEHGGDGSSSSSCTNSTSRCQETDISAEEDMKALVPQTVSLTPRNRVKRVAIADNKIIRRHRLKNQGHIIKVKPVQSNEDVVEKTLYMIEPSAENVTEGLAQNNVHATDLSQPQSSSATDNSLKNEQQADRTPKVPSVSVKKNVRHARNGTISKILLSPAVSRGFKGLRPKSFGMIQRSETQSAPSSPSSSSCPSEPVHGEHGRPTKGNVVKKSEHSKVEQKIKTRRMTLTDSEKGDCQSRKLKFRKGRMVELQPENNSPRRLKFRRVRLLGETQTPKSDSRKRNIQGKEADQNGDEVKETENSSLRQQDPELKRKKSIRRKETIDGKFVFNRIKSDRVVLRHQDSKGKNQIQNLFNNVIEETASKLAQTRKSKVKALVGAFETVISLQDTRPAATVVA